MTTLQREITVALIGNPNTGKSTLFNALSGMRQRVGNYPGVTVEKHVGQVQVGAERFALVDLPGTYSLAPRSPDEMVAVDVLLGRQPGEAVPDAVICIVDASNLERNLYLVSQVLAMGLPTVLALNMIDVAQARGVTIDLAKLRKRLGIPVVPLQANKRTGVDELTIALAKLELDKAHSAGASPFPSLFPVEFQREVAALEEKLAARDGLSRPETAENAPEHTPEHTWPRYLVERLLLDSGYLQQRLLASDDPLNAEIAAARDRLQAAGCPVPAVEALARYGWVSRVLAGVVSRPDRRPITRGDKLDKLLTHRFWGTLIFALFMAFVFCLIFIVAEWPMGWLEAGVGLLGDVASAALPEGALQSLVVNGVIAGIGGVVVFLPQILILFFFMGLMEDCGYMARAAFLMDKLMSKAGLSGKSFIPLLSSFACAIPGIMAARVIENRRDRLTTVLVAPLMSCSARLPVYSMMTTAFVPRDTVLGVFLPGLVMFSMYVLGIVVAVGVAYVLKRTLLRGETPPFVMELPGYKVPSLGLVSWRMMDRGWAFLRRAGTLIFAVSVVIWALLYYPRSPDRVEGPYRAELASIDKALEELPGNDPQRLEKENRRAQISHAIDQRYLEESFLGQAGKWIEPVVRPLGWDWKIGCAAIASFPAREVVMGTLGVIYGMGQEADVEEQSDDLVERLRSATWDDTGERVYTLPVALSIMVFFALCAQCASTLVILKRETNSWRWPAFTFVYMTGLAYVGALLTYQIGRLIA